MSVHRIRIHADRDGDPVGADVALPSGVPVGELLPTVVALVDDRATADERVRAWRLDRPTGGALMESLSLTDNGVRDGELFVLAPEGAPPLGLMRLEPCADVAATRPPARAEGGLLPDSTRVLAAILAATMLAWSGTVTHVPATLIVTAVGACAAAAVARFTGRPTAAGLAAVALAAATGFLAVPSGPATPKVFLAAAAAFAAALLVLRLCGRLSPALCCAATLSVLVAVATVVTAPIAALGALLSTASLGLLALAPRIAVVTAGLGPDHWTGEMDVRAAAGHATLTGLVAGCAGGAASGGALVAFAGVRDDAPTGGIALSALVALILVLRTRSHAEEPRQMLLTAAGLVSGASAFIAAAATHPEHTGWVGGILVAIALSAGRRPRIGAAVSRLADRLEYAALAAVVPVALWVGGAYALVGQVRLS